MKDDNLKNLIDSVASKTFFALLAIIGTGIAIYGAIQEKKVNLRYEVIANSNVLDFNADVSKLEVRYDSTDLKNTNENLRIYTIKIVNNGDKDIIKEYYDQNDPIGIKISCGKIIEHPELIKTSSNYLYRNLKIEKYEKDQFSFSQVILESGEYFIVKLLVLHKMDSIPEILSFGKIAGQKQIDIVYAIDIKKEQTFLGKTFLGSFWVQLLRLISYFFVVVTFIIVIVTISEVIDSSKEKNRKSKLIAKFKTLNNYQYNRMDDAIFDRYQKEGSLSFDKMQSLLNDEEYLNRTFNRISKTLKNKEYKQGRQSPESDKIVVDKYNWSIIYDMINDGIIFKENCKLTINQAMKGTFDQFISFLNENEEFINKYSISRRKINESDFEEIK